VMDEPMAGMSPEEKGDLARFTLDIRDRYGIPVILVEHDMDVVFDISDWVVCLAQGAVIAEGRPSEIGTNPAVIDAYLGATHNQDPTRRRKRHERRAS